MEPLVLILFFILVLLVGIDNMQDWEKIIDREKKIAELVIIAERNKRTKK